MRILASSNDDQYFEGGKPVFELSVESGGEAVDESRYEQLVNDRRVDVETP